MQRLRRILPIADARQLPVRDVVALAEDVPDGTSLSIDFAAARELGQPTVLWTAVTRVRAPLDGLTPREREVAASIAAGLSNHAIAARLCVSVATVKDHVHRILHKTGFPNRAAIAAAWAT